MFKVHTNLFTKYFCVVRHMKEERNFFITIEILDSCEQKATLYINILAIPTGPCAKQDPTLQGWQKTG